MAPATDSVRFARALSINPVFPPAFEQTAGAFAVAPFTRVRAVFVRTSGVAALDTLIAFPSSADSLSLKFAIPLAADAPASGEPLTAFLYCISALGDTVFKGGPVRVVATTQPASSGGAVAIPLAYAGPGASAARVRITPKSSTVTSGDPFVFTAVALDASGQVIANTPILYRSRDLSIAVLNSPLSGAGRSPGSAGSTFIIAQLITGQADTASLFVDPPVSTTPGIAAKLVFSAQPTNAVAGATLAPAVTVKAVDALGSVVASYTGAVTLAIGAGPAGSSLSGKTIVSAVAGIATFSNISLSAAAAGYRLAASATGLSPDSSAQFAISAAGAANIAASSGDKQTGTPLAPLGSLLAAIVTDAFGNPVSAFTVNWTVTAGQGSFASATSITNAAGIATNSWTLGADIGDQKATASSSGLSGSPVTFTATGAAGVATRLVFITRPANVLAGSVLTPAIVVQAQDGLENVQKSFTGKVTISIGRNPGGGSLAGTTTVTAVGGTATFADLSIAKAGSNYRLATASGTLAPDTSSGFDVSATNATTLAISGGDAQSGAIATQLGTQLSVTVTDANGNPVSFANVVFAIASGGGTLSNATVPTNSAGIATTKWTLGPSTGTQTVSATSAGLSGSPAIFTATAIAGAAKHLTIVSSPSSGVAGNALTPAIVVNATDVAGNPAPSFTGGVSLSFDANPGGATLGGTTSVNAVAGVATFASVTINRAGTGYRLRANAGGLTGDTTATFSVTAAVATTIAANAGSGQTGLVASALPTPISVLVTDAGGNPVPGVSVAWAAASGGGSVSAATSVTNALGIASTNWTMGPVVGAETATATVASLAGSPVTFTANAIASAATKLVIVAQPSNVAAGAAISPPIIVQARDATGNLVSAFSGTVALSMGTNPAGATLGGTTSATASLGVATFSGVTLNRVGAGFTLVASAGGLSSEITAAFSVTTGPAATLTITGGNNQTNLATRALSNPLSVSVTDASGNPVGGVAVSWTVASGAGSLGATSSLTSASGVATNTWTLGGAAGVQTVTASVSGLVGSPATFSATATAGTPTHLSFTTRPGNAVAGANLSPSIVISALDSAENVATTFSGPVTVSFATNPGGGTLNGTTTVNAAGGVASFGGISITKAASGYRLAASSGALTPDTLPPFSISAAAPAALSITAGNNQSAAVSHVVATPPAVSVADAFGNPVSGVSIAWTVVTGGGSVGSASTLTNGSGIATTAWTLGSLTGAQSLTATAAGLVGSPATFSATAIAGAATHLVISSQPAGGLAGAAFGIVVTALDAGGNVATSFTSNIVLTLGVRPGGSSLVGGGSVNAIAGVATYPGLSITKAFIGYTLSAAAGGLGTAASNPFNIDAAAPATISISGGNNQSSIIALLLGTPLAVTVVDAFSNPVPNVTVTWAVLTGGGTLGSSIAQTSAAGVATNTWTLGALLGAQTVRATAAGLPGSPVTFTATGLP